MSNLWKKVQKLEEEAYQYSWKLQETTGYKISIYYKGPIFVESKKDIKDVYFGVNWPAIGTVHPDEAEEFIKVLKKAVRKAKSLNKKLAKLK